MKGKIKAIIFDLDYTLYDMDQYLDQAYPFVAKSVCELNKVEYQKCLECLTTCCSKYGRLHDKLFNFWLGSMDLLSDENLENAIEAFHGFQINKLYPYDGLISTLQNLKQKYKLGIITDGKVQTQKNKVKCLDLIKYFDQITYTDLLNTSKPDPYCFTYTLGKMAVSPKEVIFVGDHPIKDIKGAVESNLRAIRIVNGAFSKMADEVGCEPETRIDQIEELLMYV
ncbi:MAG TPA: HAD-IA family hydrolase [Fulvivirga sp.]|nr:HAD-IA family hydrolase [Fulvivirga sp.]